MSRTRPIPFLVLPALMLAALAAWTAPARADKPKADDTPIEIKPAANVDERLFLLYALEDVYRSFPTTGASRADLEGWIADTRNHMRRLSHQAKENKLDDDLVGVYADCLQVLEAYETFLANLGAIDREQVARRDKESFDNGFDAGQAGVKAFQNAKAQGKTDEDALKASVAVGLIDWLLREIVGGYERNEDRRRAVEAESRKFRGAWEDAVARAEVVAARLKTRHAWRDGEANFGDSDKLGAVERAKRQPRNPFVLAAYANIRGKDEKAADLMRDAGRCLTAARLVPTGKVYDSYRTRFMSDAARLATWAAMHDQGPRGFCDTPSEHAPEAVRYWRTVASCQGGELSEYGRWKLWEALACAGRHKEALEIAYKQLPWSNKNRNSSFAYNVVCLEAITGQDADHLLKNLEAAFGFGYDNVSLARKDPDLARLRKERAEKFEDLVKVKPDYRLIFGVFNDDVTMTNNSHFPLSNVVLDVRFEQDGRVWTRQLKAPRIAAGETYKWEDCISIPDSRVSAWYVDLKCDQKK